MNWKMEGYEDDYEEFEVCPICGSIDHVYGECRDGRD
jgi:hypothetical protein